MQISKHVDSTQIAARAYEIWEAEGCPDGCDRDHWLRAESELSVAAAKTRNIATGPKTTTTPKMKIKVQPHENTAHPA